MNRFRATVAGLVAAMTSLALVGVAGATTTDPTDQAFTDAKTGILHQITANAVPLIVAVLLAGIGISLLVKFVRKGVRAA